MKRKISAMLAVFLSLSVLMTMAFSITAFAAAKGKITIGSAQAKSGQSVDITISMTTNPGMATVDFEVTFDSSVLTLEKVNDEKFVPPGEGVEVAHSDQLVTPYHLSWLNDLAKEDFTKTGKMVTLTFKVADNAKPGTYDIKVDSKTVEIFDHNIKDVDFEFENGAVNVSSGASYIVGDVNGDGKVSKADSMILTRYIGGWKDYDKKIVNMDAADLNRDGQIKKADSMILTRYIGGWSGYDKYIFTVS